MKKMKLIYFIYFLFPLINLITGLMTRYNVCSLTLGVIIRFLLLAFIVVYLFFLSKSKYKKVSIIYLIVLALYSIVYLATRKNILTFSILFEEVNYLFKFVYFPIMFFGLLNLVDENKYDTKKWEKIFLYGLIFYIVFILIPAITQTSFHTYLTKHYGIIGWFYAGNEVGPILLLLFPSVFTLLDKKKVGYFILSTLGILVILLLLTKVSRYGLIILLTIFIICYLIFVKNKWVNKLCLTITFLILAFFNISYGERVLTFIEHYTFVEQYNPVKTDNDNNKNNNNQNNNESENSNKPTISDIIENSKDKNITEKTKLPSTDDKDFSTKLLSSRNKRVQKVFDNYLENDKLNITLGFGFNLEETILLEMDFFDIFYHYGIIGFILLMFPYIYMLYFAIRSIIKKKFKFSISLVFTTLIFGLILSISFLAGHIIGSPAVGSYLCVFAVYICVLLDDELLLKEQKKKIDD